MKFIPHQILIYFWFSPKSVQNDVNKSAYPEIYSRNRFSGQSKKPLGLGEVRWKNYYEQVSAKNMWPHSWLRLVVDQQKQLTNQEAAKERDLRLRQLELLIYSWPNLEGGKTCINHYKELGKRCDYEEIQHIAAMYLTQSFRKYVTWQLPEQSAILEAKGLRELSSAIYHFYKCSNGIKSHCPNPCKHADPCGSIDNAEPGTCIVVDPSATRGWQRMKFNAAWVFSRVKCRCVVGYAWDELQGLCVRDSVCDRHEPCNHNGTIKCEDSAINDFKCICKLGYSGVYCDQVDMCITNNMCQPNGFCVKVKSSRKWGQTYRCNCSLGYADDVMTPVPDCTVHLKAFFAYKDYTPPLVYFIIAICCCFALLVTYCIVRHEQQHQQQNDDSTEQQKKGRNSSTRESMFNAGFGTKDRVCAQAIVSYQWLPSRKRCQPAAPYNHHEEPNGGSV